MGQSDNILIFGGTTEGRQLAEFCSEHGIPACVSVATEYGGTLLDNLPAIRVTVGRKDEAAMTEFIKENRIRLVIDATHPYATEATHHIAAACRACGVACYRVLREGGQTPAYGHFFDTIDDVVRYLNTHDDGAILLTTGSKDLKAFCQVKNYGMRCAVRVLPAEGIAGQCESLGFARERVIAQKGPFSEEQNIAHLRRYNAKYLVTKESGSAGGFNEKANAAETCGAELLIIRRPRENGISLTEAKQILTKQED